jgi:hypothetical protein
MINEQTMDCIAPEKNKIKLLEILNGIKEEERINFLVNRLLNTEHENDRLKIDLVQLKKDNSKVILVGFY